MKVKMQKSNILCIELYLNPYLPESNAALNASQSRHTVDMNAH